MYEDTYVAGIYEDTYVACIYEDTYVACIYEDTYVACIYEDTSRTPVRAGRTQQHQPAFGREHARSQNFLDGEHLAAQLLDGAMSSG